MSAWRLGAISLFGTTLLRGLFATTRTTLVDAHHLEELREAGRPVVFVLWHGQLLPLVHQHREEGVAVLVSEHRDGEYIARVLERSGFETVRGSSTRGGTRGLKGLIRAAREGKDLALTPDGPRGPAHVLKAGALGVAQATGLPVIPVAVGASAGWRFRSWDGFLVPRPLSRITIQYAPAVHVPRNASRERLEEAGREVQDTLNTLTADLNPGWVPPGGGAPPGAESGPPPSDGSPEPHR